MKRPFNLGLRRRGSALFLPVLLAVATALLAAGCGSNSGAEADAPTDAVTAGSTAKDLYLGTEDPKVCGGREYTIGYDVFSDTESFAVLQQEDMERLAAKLGCVKLVKLVDNADPATALKNVNTFVQQGVDGVVLFQVVAAAQPGLMRVLDNAGIPAVSTAIPAPGSTFVNEDDYQSGLLGGKALGTAFKERFGDASPWVVIGAFPSGGEVSEKRMEGFRDGVERVIPKIPSSQVLEIDTQADPATANQRMNDVLGRVPQGSKVMIAGINDDVTNAMYQAARKQGRGEDMVVVSPGGVNPVGLEYACETKAYAGVVEFFPEKWASYLLPAILDRVQEKKVPDAVFIPTEFLDKAGIAKAYPDVSC